MVERVTLQEAARRLGVSVRTLQRRIRAGQIGAETVATRRGHRVMVLLETDVAGPDSATTTPSDELSALLAELRGERDWLRGRVEALEESVRRLTVLAAQAQHVAQLPSGEGDSATPPDATLARSVASPSRQPRSLWLRLLDALRGP